ncbi:hypothetical protein B4064_2776 [Caldibacillus thermoamylovorans]|nr:hypothetical protein B4064_2776 [Caldibacillus thermoamylovorans]
MESKGCAGNMDDLRQAYILLFICIGTMGLNGLKMIGGA